MKIIVIHASMRKGNTYKLTQTVISRLKVLDVNVEIEELSVEELELPFCSSCHVCFTSGEKLCPHYNIIKAVTDKIKQCDGIILTGVVYSLHLNAAMKNLIDHLSFFIHRPCLFDKKGMVITTTAGAAEKTVAKYLKNIMSCWGVNCITVLREKIQTNPFSLNPKQTERVEKAAKSFYEAILDNKYRDPGFNEIMVFNAFRGMNTGDKPLSQCDKAYWEQTGLKDCTYPLKHNIIKRLFGCMVYKVLKNQMSKK